MDDRAERRPNPELVKANGIRPSSGVVPAKPLDGATTDARGITTGAFVEGGKYLVGREIGGGAVGTVFEAKDVERGETVAIKRLRGEMLVDAELVARFMRAAKAAAAIESEHVATVRGVGTTEDGVPYVVREYLEGKDLGAVIAAAGVLSPRAAVEYTLQVCDALAAAHARGMFHRDIKPENLLVAQRSGGMPIVKVLDFGVSKNALTESIPQNERFLGNCVNLAGPLLFMSPEQVRCSGGVDARSDIWSLGMVMYAMLTGHTAFGGRSRSEICAAILEAPPDPIELHRTNLPSGLVEVIAKCLQKDAAKRYQNAGELALALMPFGPTRTRLDVERAVAVLQRSGHLAPNIRVDSSMPPSPSDFDPCPLPTLASEPEVAAGSELSLTTASSAERPSGGAKQRRVLGLVLVVVFAAAVALAVARCS